MLLAVPGAGPDAASEELVSSEVESATIACPSDRTRCRPPSAVASF